jgi:hypothetical protein
MTFTEGLMILSTLAGPLVAVQVTRYLDDRNEVRGRKLQIYKTLMATRAYTISIAHVEALNLIDLEFSSRNSEEKRIIEVWRQYLDLLGDKALSPEQWNVKRVDLLVALGYDFDKTQIKNATYSPVAHGRVEDEQDRIRQYTLELLQGKRVLPMHVTNLPPQPAQVNPSNEK